MCGVDPMNDYGVHETNGVLDPEAHIAHIEAAHKNPRVLGDEDVVRITRLRLLTERGYPYFDVSYCYGELKNGEACVIQVPFMHLPRKNTRRALVEWAGSEGRYAKGMGLLDEGNWSILWG